MSKHHQSEPGPIAIGPLEFTHNQFLLLLAGLAAMAMAIASFLSPLVSPLSKALEPQLIWAYQLLVIGAGGAALFHRAGFNTTARNCILIAGGVLLGAALKVFLV